MNTAMPLSPSRGGDHTLGRSRGDLSTTIQVRAKRRGKPIASVLMAGLCLVTQACFLVADEQRGEEDAARSIGDAACRCSLADDGVVPEEQLIRDEEA